MREDRVEVVWDAIALHTSPDIAARKRPEIALVSAGAGADLKGGPAALPEAFAELTGREFPRLDVTTDLERSHRRARTARRTVAERVDVGGPRTARTPGLNA